MTSFLYFSKNAIWLFSHGPNQICMLYFISVCATSEKKNELKLLVIGRPTDGEQQSNMHFLLYRGGGHIKVPLLLHVGDICCRTNRNTLFSLMIYTKYIFSADASEELQTTLDLCFRDGSLSCQLLIQTLDIKVISRKYRTDESGNHLRNPNW